MNQKNVRADFVMLNKEGTNFTESIRFVYIKSGNKENLSASFFDKKDLTFLSRFLKVFGKFQGKDLELFPCSSTDTEE